MDTKKNMGLANTIRGRHFRGKAFSIVREVTKKTPPSRALCLHFPFGHALGEPGNTNQHFAVLLLALRLLFEAEGPATILDAGLRWRQESYPTPDWEAFGRLGPVR